MIGVGLFFKEQRQPNLGLPTLEMSSWKFLFPKKGLNFSSLFTFAFVINALFLSSAAYGQTSASVTWSVLSSLSATSTNGAVTGSTATLTGIDGMTAYNDTIGSVAGWAKTGGFLSATYSSGIYVEFSIAPTTGNNITVNSISGYFVGYASENTKMAAYYSVDNFINSTNLGSCTYNGASSNTSTTDPISLTDDRLTTTSIQGATVFTPTISVKNGQTLKIRLYIWNKNGTAKKLGLRNIVLSGTTTSTSSTPTVTTGSASSITTTGAILNGTINAANGAATTISFDYGTTTAYGTNAGGTNSPTSSSATNVSSSYTKTGLTANTLYNFRIKGVNSAGTTNGNNATFTTLPGQPTIAAESAITSTGFRANWTAPSQGGATFTYTLEYGTDNTFASKTTVTGISAIFADISGLSMGVTYYYRVKCSNTTGDGAYSASYETVTTTTSAPTVTTQAVSSITSTTATGNGTIISTGGSTTNWVSGICWKTSTGPTTADSKTTNGTSALSAYIGNLISLAPNTKYYVKAYATNNIGTSYGSEVNFNSLSLPPTISSGSSATNVGFTANWSVPGTQGSETFTYTVEVSTSSGSFDANIVSSSIVTGISSSSVSQAITGLSPSTTYYFRVKAVNTSGSNASGISTGIATLASSSSTDYFRSKTTGNWNASTTWESSANGSTGWINANQTPTSTSAEITILNEHTVTMSADVSADNMTIASGGQLIVSSGLTLTVTNGTGTDLTINGTLINSGTVIATGTIVVGNGGLFDHNQSNMNVPVITWNTGAILKLSGTYSGAGTESFTAGDYYNIIYTGNIPIATDYVSLGTNIITIANKLTASGIGDGALLLTRPGTATSYVQEYEQTSGNVYINRNASGDRSFTVLGNATISAGTMYVKTLGNIYAGILYIEGNLTIGSGAVIENNGTDGLASIVFSGNTNTPQLFTNAGNFNNGSSATTMNITVNSGAIVNLGTSDFGTSTHERTFTSQAGATIKTAHTSGINGNINLIGTITLNTGTNFEFNGSTPQITSALMPATVNNLNINNTSGVTLSKATSVSNILTLNSGKFTTSVTNTLNINNTATTAISGGNTTSYIDGPVTWALPLNPTSGSNYLFPVGKSDKYLPFTLVNPTTSGISSAKIEAYNTGSGGTVDGLTLNSISSTEYWSLVTGTNFTNSSVTLAKATAISPFNTIGGSTSASGEYNFLSGTKSDFSVSNSNQINANRFFTLAFQDNFWRGNLSTDWGTASNWTAGYIPDSGQKIEFADGNNITDVAQNDLSLDTDRTISQLINKSSKALVVNPGKTLTVNSTITTSNNTNQISILADSILPNGSLIFHNSPSQPVYATVQMWSQSCWDTSQPVNQKYNWQFFGIPIDTVKASPTVDGAYLRFRDEAGNDTTTHWQSLTNTSNIIPFMGYELCYQTQRFISFKGKLVNRDFNSGQLAKTTTEGVLYGGQHIFSNPYTTAIDINLLDFGSAMEQNIYLYNTGSFAQWHAGLVGESDKSPGQYTSASIGYAGVLGVPGQIPSMSSILVKVTSSTSEAYLNINYNTMTIGNAEQQRVRAINNIRPSIIGTRIDLQSENAKDKLWLFVDDKLSRSFDNGYDAKKISGSALNQQIFAVEEDGNYQIDAVEDINDTRIAFRAGQDSLYKMIFNHENISNKYSGLYLFDMVENKIINVTENGATYNFTALSTPSSVLRFKIISKTQTSDTEEKPDIIYFNINKVLYIFNQGHESCKIYLYDLSGRIIAHETIPANGNVNIPVNSQHVYILKIEDSTSTNSVKIIAH